MIRWLAIVGLLLCTGIGPAPAQGPPGPPARNIPGIVVKDPYPNACVDCHINYVDMKMDTRFSTLLKQWAEQVGPKLLAKAQATMPAGKKLTGKHPNAAHTLKDIPAKCLVCHGKTSKIAPPFASMIHLIHFSGGNENHFLTLFQGECTYCHKINLSDGRWKIPSAAER
jgi:hypothetical protein